MDEIEYIKDHIEKIKTIIGNNVIDIKWVRPTKTGRKICTIIFPTHKITTQVARIIIQCELGRVLNNDETVDHIDGDKTNNKIDNLQVLSLRDNVIKGSKISKADISLKGLKTKIKNDSIIKGEQIKQSILTTEQVVEIRKLYFNGSCSYNELSERYGVNKTNISHIINRRTWKHI